MNELSTAPAIRTNPWPPAAASLVCSAAGLYFFFTYGLLRWQVLMHSYDNLDEGVKASIFQIVSMLQAYRAFGPLAVAFAIWAVLHKPRWPGVLCFIPAAAALVASLVTIK